MILFTYTAVVTLTAPVSWWGRGTFEFRAGFRRGFTRGRAGVRRKSDAQHQAELADAYAKGRNEGHAEGYGQAVADDVLRPSGGPVRRLGFFGRLDGRES